MPVPKIAGIETEYGIALRGGVAEVAAVRNFFEEVMDSPVLWDYQTESPARDARGGALSNPAAGPTVPNKTRNREATSIPVVVERDLSTLLPNGARFYIDHAHPEYCTPECLTVRELVAHDKAGERWLMKLSAPF